MHRCKFRADFYSLNINSYIYIVRETVNRCSVSLFHLLVQEQLAGIFKASALPSLSLNLDRNSPFIPSNFSQCKTRTHIFWDVLSDESHDPCLALVPQKHVFFGGEHLRVWHPKWLSRSFRKNRMSLFYGEPGRYALLKEDSFKWKTACKVVHVATLRTL